MGRHGRRFIDYDVLTVQVDFREKLVLELQKLFFISICAIKIRTFAYEEFEGYATHRKIK